MIAMISLLLGKLPLNLTCQCAYVIRLLKRDRDALFRMHFNNIYVCVCESACVRVRCIYKKQYFIPHKICSLDQDEKP